MTLSRVIGYGALAALFACAAAPPQPTVLENSAQRGEIFAEIFDNPSRLEQIRQDVSSRQWKIDCVGYGAAQPFLRVQLPAGATFKDIEYFIYLPGRSTVRMVYETQPKELCPKASSR